LFYFHYPGIIACRPANLVTVFLIGPANQFRTTFFTFSDLHQGFHTLKIELIMVRATVSATTKKRKRNKWLMHGNTVGLCRTLFSTGADAVTLCLNRFIPYIA
jgi:hypothetical protein